MKKIREIIGDFSCLEIDEGKIVSGEFIPKSDYDKLEQELQEYVDNKIAEVVWEYEVNL